MWGGLFLFCYALAIAAFLVSRRLSRPLRRLGLFFGILSSALAVPVGHVAAFEAVMCSSEMTGRGVLAGSGLRWSIEHQGCGATTGGIYTVRLGFNAWWGHTILTADAFSVPRLVEAVGEGSCAHRDRSDSAGDTRVRKA